MNKGNAVAAAPVLTGISGVDYIREKRTGEDESSVGVLNIDRSGIFVSPSVELFGGVASGMSIAAESVESRKIRNAARR
jgi:hypothetical protein